VHLLDAVSRDVREPVKAFLVRRICKCGSEMTYAFHSRVMEHKNVCGTCRTVEWLLHKYPYVDVREEV